MRVFVLMRKKLIYFNDLTCFALIFLSILALIPHKSRAEVLLIDTRKSINGCFYQDDSNNYNQDNTSVVTNINNSYDYYLKGSNYYEHEQGKLTEAVEEIKTAIRLAPNNWLCELRRAGRNPKNYADGKIYYKDAIDELKSPTKNIERVKLLLADAHSNFLKDKRKNCANDVLSIRNNPSRNHVRVKSPRPECVP